MPEPTFRHIACHMDGGVLVVTLVDSQIKGHEVADELRQELLDAAALYPTRKWVLDFRQVDYFSSGGIHPLLTLHRKIQGTVGRLIFCNLRRDLLDVFMVTRLISPSRSATSPFELARDLPEALAKLRHVTRAIVEGVLVFTLVEPNLHGDLLADELTTELEVGVAETGIHRVVLDFQHVQAITTPCMRPMLHLRSLVRMQGGRVVLANLSILVEEVLAVTRLVAPNPVTPGLFESYPDTESAVKALKV